MIDPADVIKYDRTDAELEEWWLFSTIVAGKTAATQARILESFLARARHYSSKDASPFDAIRALLGMNQPEGNRHSALRGLMEWAHIGQYNRLERCWTESMALDLRNDSVEAFEAIHGVGAKTARMFVMHSRPNQRLAAIDTHILKFLKANGHIVPKATPSSAKQYRELEIAFLALADAAGQSPSEYDLAIWKTYAT